MSQIQARNFIDKLKQEDLCVIDVRTKGEFEHQAIKSARCLPLDEIEKRMNEVPKDQAVYMICRSGKRSQVAVDKLKAHGFDNVINVQGGMVDYAKLGGEVQQITKTLPVMRQVQMIAGLMVLLGVLLSMFVSPSFIYLSGFVGVGLLIAGVTGYCALGELLYLMPWNRANDTASDSNCCKP